jgi:hypothetical protein
MSGLNRPTYPLNNYKKSVLCKNIKVISPETWEAINGCLVGFARDADIEKGHSLSMAKIA